MNYGPYQDLSWKGKGAELTERLLCVSRLRLSYYFFIISGGGTLGTAATTGLLYQPQTIDDGDCGEIGE
jgi:hypothetical protein